MASELSQPLKEMGEAFVDLAETVRGLRDRISTLTRERDEALAALADVRDILEDAPELNPSNYDHEQACELNSKMVEACLFLRHNAPSAALAARDERMRREGAAEELKDLLKGIGSDPELKAYLETKDVIASAYTTRIMARIAALEKVATSTPRRRTYGPEISADIAAKIEAAKIVGELRVLRKLEVQCELNRRNPADGSSTVTVGEIRAEIAALEAKE